MSIAPLFFLFLAFFIFPFPRFQKKSDFEIKQFFESQQKATNAAASNSVKELDDAIKNVGDDVVKEFLGPRFKLKNTDQRRQLFREKLQRILKPNDPASIRLLKDDFKRQVDVMKHNAKEIWHAGDDDQCIHRWNGVSVEDFMNSCHNIEILKHS